MTLQTLADAGLLDHDPTQDEIENAALSEEDYALLVRWWNPPRGHEVLVNRRDWDPDKHPRDDHGRFSSTPDGSSGKRRSATDSG